MLDSTNDFYLRTTEGNCNSQQHRTMFYPLIRDLRLRASEILESDHQQQSLHTSNSQDLPLMHPTLN